MKNNELNKMQKQNKLLKGFVIGLSILSIVGVAASIAAPLVVLNKNKGSDSKTTTYNVTFKDGDTTISTQKVVENEKATKPQDPTKEDYSFGGWYDNESCEGDPFNFDTSITKATTLYAKWTYDFAPELPNYKSATTLFAVEQSIITFASINSSTNMQYSRTGAKNSWLDATAATKITVPKGECLYLKGNNEDGLSTSSDCWNITITGKCNVGGSIMGLLDDGNGTITSIPSNSSYCFYHLFQNSPSLYKVSSNFLPAKTLADNCYTQIFWNCYSLVQPPKLPAEELADNCYRGLFQGCYSLVTAPELPATVLANNCYQNMFMECVNLKNPPVLSCKYLKQSCYSGMFQSCSSLMVAPELPAAELQAYCYNSMFYECASLKIKEVKPDEQAPTEGKIFTCPGTLPLFSTTSMFYGTSGSFSTSDPTVNNSYYWYNE